MRDSNSPYLWPYNYYYYNFRDIFHLPWHDTRQPIAATIFGQNRIVRRAAIVEYQMITFARTVRPGAYGARGLIEAGNGAEKQNRFCMNIYVKVYK